MALAELTAFEYPAGSHELHQWWMLFCLSISTLGIALRVWTIGCVPAGTSGRNTGEQIAATLNTDGVYSLLRHPLYLGNFLIWLGTAATTRSAWVVMVVVLVFALYHERIIYAEEAFLSRRFGERFYVWASQTRAFLPAFVNWVPARLPFSVRHALEREYRGIFALMSLFTVIEHLADWSVRDRFVLEWPWVLAWSLSLVFFLVVRVLSKRTCLLVVEGR